VFNFANTCTLSLFVRLQGKSQSVKEELSKLGEQMVQSSEGTRAVALELCREFEDKFLAHVTSGEVSEKLELWSFCL
jgi:dynamin GTPase